MVRRSHLILTLLQRCVSFAFLSSVLSGEYYTYYQIISLNFARVKKNMMRQFVCGSQFFWGSYLNLTGKRAFKRYWFLRQLSGMFMSKTKEEIKSWKSLVKFQSLISGFDWTSLSFRISIVIRILSDWRRRRMPDQVSDFTIDKLFLFFSCGGCCFQLILIGPFLLDFQSCLNSIN